MTNQANFGIGNENTHIEIKNGIVYLNADSPRQYSISELWDALINQFKIKDDEINRLLPENVLINKTQGKEQFSSSKIISSLMKIGIPFPATVEIVENTIMKVEKWISENENSDHRLTTKIIRQIVSSVIQNLDSTKWSRMNIENWNAKYVRRYGHNNRIVQIYDIPQEINTEPIVNISYEFIRRSLIPDIIRTLFPDVNVSKEVSSKNLSEMSDEIIAFINSCDLYMIRYTLLKDMISEIAIQFPHPWFVCNSKRASIIAHDKESVQKNLQLAYNVINRPEQKKILSSSIIVELLHHASSLVLEKYFSFLGCYDLTAFYRLSDIITKLTPDSDNTEVEWDLLISDYAFKKLFDDMTISGVDPVDYRNNINRIYGLLKDKKTNTSEFTRLLIEFGKYCLQIHNFGDQAGIESFLDKSWATYSNPMVCQNIKTLLLLIYPHKRHRMAERNASHFWITYRKSSSVYTMKSRVFVVVADRKNIIDYSALQILGRADQRATCNTIIIVAEELRDVVAEREYAFEQLRKYGLDSDYNPIILTKRDIKNIFYSLDRIAYFDELIENQIQV